ncbi:MAG TPA: adenylate/guanylate cyclase domain-containing protein, partial [Burkholderiales bacterium]|nr:adenylate/guanylate cyclase domain-containing protein [Burkholderiales bacterium]
MTASLLWAAAFATLVGALALLMKQSRRIRQLERLVEDTHARLERLQLHFARFAPDDVVEQLTDPGGELKPTRRTVTVLFADLKGFTALSDRMDPEQMVPILNGYFQAMSVAIAAHHGRVTELIGDGMLALFGALEPNPWQAQDAVLGALAMREALARYNDTLRARSLPELQVGIGIHRGEVLAGVMGNEELSKFGVVGDTINVASRVEQLTRELSVDLLITEEVRRELDRRFQLRAMPP